MGWVVKQRKGHRMAGSLRVCPLGPRFGTETQCQMLRESLPPGLSHVAVSSGCCLLY